MFSGVTSSARSPSHPKMMTRRAGGPPCCGAAGPPTSPSTTNDKAIKTMNPVVFMAVLVSEFEGGRSARRSTSPDDLDHRAPHGGSSPSPPRESYRHPRLLAEPGCDLPPTPHPAHI